MSPPFRFLVDEASWECLDGMESTALENVLEALVDRIELANSRRERVGKFSEIWDFSVGAAKLYDFLFRSDTLERDLKTRISSCLDKLPSWDETLDTPALDCEIANRTLFAPSIGLAHSLRGQGQAVALLPLTKAGRRGRLAVTANGIEHAVHFVTDDVEHVTFFREAIEVENANEKAFEALAPSAFPNLKWADKVFSGLRDFSRPFRNIRQGLVHHLGVLNDHGAEIFREKLSTAPAEIEGQLSALGAPASDENGKTKSHTGARRERTRTFEGREFTFFWHCKLQPHIDRIHFLYESEQHRIVVGIFTSHCRGPEDL